MLGNIEKQKEEKSLINSKYRNNPCHLGEYSSRRFSMHTYKGIYFIRMESPFILFGTAFYYLSHGYLSMLMHVLLDLHF